MRKNTSLILGTLIASIAVCALTNAQSSPARRTPVLTNDDLGSSPREVVRLPADPVENVPQPVRPRNPQVVPGAITWQLTRAVATWRCSA